MTWPVAAVAGSVPPWPRPLSIAFVSDVVCPWCVIGIRSLERAIAATGLRVNLSIEPFELNPGMQSGGQNMRERLREKYGATNPGAGGRIRAMAAALGFDMPQRADARIYNTFDAHRLLHGAGDRQLPLKHALFAAYFQHGRDPGDADVLMAAAETAGLDPAQARRIIGGDAGADAVRAAEARWRGEGIFSVPTAVIDERYIIQGAQETAAYDRALRRIAAERISPSPAA